MEKLDDFPVLYKSVVLWLLDLMVEVVQNKEKNKMSAKNMGKDVEVSAMQPGQLLWVTNDISCLRQRS